jgi:hypothetical protein
MTNETEDTEMVYDDYDNSMSMDPFIAREDKDFLDQCILFLHLLQKAEKKLRASDIILAKVQ